MTTCLTHRTASGTSSSSVPFIKPPRISNPLSLRLISLFLLPPPIPSPVLPSGHSTVSPLVSWLPAFGVSLMNVATKHSQSPSSPTTSSAGSSTLGQCNFLLPLTCLRWEPALTEHFTCQSRSSLPFLAYNTCETPCSDWAYDTRSSLCPMHPFTAWPLSDQSRW